MRYLIVADRDQRIYEKVEHFLVDHQVKIALKNDRRGMISIEDPPREILVQLAELGARVHEEVQYAFD